MKITRAIPVLALLSFAGCDYTTIDDFGSGNLRFVSGIHGTVDVLVDGQPLFTGIPLGGSFATTLPPGSFEIVIRKVGGVSGVLRTATVSLDGTTLVIGTDSAGVPRPSILLDTNAIVPAGATKLRVAHFAAAAPPITAWRTQPDFGTMIRVQFPFPYETAGTYMQSTVGDWKVMISSEQNASGSAPMPDTLAFTSLIPIASGQSRTVVVVDGATAGSVQLVVVEP